MVVTRDRIRSNDFNYQHIQCLTITTKTCEFEPCSRRATLDNKHCEHYVMMFVSDLRQVAVFLQVLRFPPPIKANRHDMTNIVESGVKHHNSNII